MGHYMILIIFGASLLSGLAAIDFIADDDDVVIYYYKQSSVNTPVVVFPLDQRQNVAPYFDATKQTLFIIHGWLNDYSSAVNTLIKSAVFNVYDVNIFVVDWTIIATNPYSIAVLNVASVGKRVGQFINELVTNYTYSYSSVRIVGHSLGAHVSGHAGRTTNSNVASIVALDPAGPLYGVSIEEARMEKTDAQYVQVIHTCTELLGYPFALGDSDFWPNSGIQQPGCGILGSSCSHSRAYELYAESISSNGFVSKKCSSYLSYTLNFCNSGETAIMGGYVPDTSKTGNFYLKTNSESLYAKF